MRAPIISCLALGLFVSSAWAADKPTCLPLDALKKKMGDQVHYSPLTPGQINFARGVYVAVPESDGSMSDRMPSGDTAILATKDGSPGGIILWMRGPLVCEPTPIGEKLLSAMKKIKTGKLDAEGNEI